MQCGRGSGGWGGGRSGQEGILSTLKAYSNSVESYLFLNLRYNAHIHALKYHNWINKVIMKK